MDRGVAADGENAREDDQGAADGSGLGAAVDPALVANGDGGAMSEEGSVEGAAEGVDGVASAGGGGSTAAGLGQGTTVAGGSAAGVARDSGRGSARLASATWACPNGMDPNSTYLLRIKSFGSPKKARKDILCFCFEKVIDCALTNYKDLVESIVEKYPPHYMGVAHMQYYDGGLKTCPKVKSDHDLMLMFEKHSETKVDMIIAYCDPSEPYEPITEWQSDVHSEPNNNIEHEDDTTNKRYAKGGGEGHKEDGAY
ncbi:uncharacterized protein LOC119311507 [Triticum dicoccoides]|uniref:uncharacterized protein LOC119311507 n=1 Tax=Triticum dicoccoides TaxID=85692 RepID=UPI001891DE1A|nr:uncharacterized protein LOC119311507 [Triticum dicoccoides]